MYIYTYTFPLFPRSLIRFFLLLSWLVWTIAAPIEYENYYRSRQSPRPTLRAAPVAPTRSLPSPLAPSSGAGEASAQSFQSRAPARVPTGGECHDVTHVNGCSRL